MLYTENIAALFFYLVTCSGLVKLTNGLVEPLTLCETQDPVTVRELSGGTIQHVQRTAGAPGAYCELLLTGFSSSAYVSLPGVVREDKLYPCSDTSSKIVINEVQHCVIPSAEGAIIQLTNGTLTLRLVNQTVANFTLDYYSNVNICNGESSVLTIPRNATYAQLSCIIASTNIRTQLCSTVIKNLKDRAVIVELLYTTLCTDEAATFDEFEITKASPRIFRNPRDELTITYSREQSGFFQYIIKLTVLTCGEVPQVQNTSSDLQNTDSSAAIWFSGTQVNYTCIEEGYEFRDVSSLTCQLDSANHSLEWSNISDIKCIPVPRCLNPLKNLSYMEVNRSRDDLTATYQCIPGYKVPAGPETVTVTCRSPDPDTVRWTWNDTDTELNCTKVECSVVDINGSISNGTVILEDIYYYLDHVNYICNEGYVKGDPVICREDGGWSSKPQCMNETLAVECHVGNIRNSISNGEVSRKEIYGHLNNLSYRCKEEYVKSGFVTCQANGNWSAEPKCVAKELTGDISVTVAIIGGSTGGPIVIIITIAVTVKLKTHRRQRSKLSQSSTEINKDTERVGQSEENPYFELEAPDVIRGHATSPTINQCGADLSAGPYEVVVLEAPGVSADKSQVEATKPAPSAETPTTNYTARQNESADVYAEVQAPKGHRQPSPPNPIKTPDPVYAEAPAVPVKLGETGTPSPQPATDGVAMVENSLYASVGGGDHV